MAYQPITDPNTGEVVSPNFSGTAAGYSPITDNAGNAVSPNFNVNGRNSAGNFGFQATGDNPGYVDNFVAEGPKNTEYQNAFESVDIKSFVASFATDIARPARFDVTLFVPPLFSGDPNVGPGIATTRQLRLRCESANFPGRTLETQQVQIYGPAEKFPYRTSYDDITLEFICSSSMIEKSLFDLWLEYINPSETWNVRFKNNYCTQILITQYDSNIRRTHQIQLVDAFPVAVTQMDLNWNDEGYHKIAVTFAYTYWKKISDYQAEYVPDGVNIDSPFYIDNLQTIISAILLAKDVATNMGKSPYGILGVIGAASSLFAGGLSLSQLLNGTNPGNNRFEDSNSVRTPGTITGATTDVNNLSEDL